MKSKALLFALLFVVILSQAALAKSYSYDYIKTNLDFEPNGTVIVRQERAYDFSGSFSYAYLDIMKKGSTGVSFLGITDLDTNQSLNYQLQDTPSDVKATWYYSANNQVKRFLIVYKIDGAVQRYSDVAEFYWKVIENSHESISNLDSYVNLPSPSPSLFKIFVHSSASPGQIDFSNDLRSATVSMTNIPTNTFVEFRVLTDPSIFTGVQQINENRYQAILDEESMNFYSSLFDSSVFYVLIFIIVPIVLFLYFYLRYGREPKVDYQLNYEQEPPSDIPPMALSVLCDNEKIPAKGLLATIFDLARRGYIDIREEKKVRTLMPDKTEQIFKITAKGRGALSPKSELLDFEKDVLSLLFEDMSKKKDEISSSEISEWCRWNRSTIRGEVKSMRDKAIKWFEGNHFKIYESKSLRESKEFVVIFAVYMIFLILFLFVRGIFIDPRFIILPSIFFVLFAIGAIKRRTPESTLEVKKWKAFGKYIRDFSAMKDAPLTLLKIWDRYLIYAVVLGVARELLENIKDFSAAKNMPVAAVVWYHPIGTPGIPRGMMSPEAFGSFSSSMNSMISALSSSSSVGGGFSGGGGGGGGGGGSGAG